MHQSVVCVHKNVKFEDESSMECVDPNAAAMRRRVYVCRCVFVCVTLDEAERHHHEAGQVEQEAAPNHGDGGCDEPDLVEARADDVFEEGEG